MDCKIPCSTPARPNPFPPPTTSTAPHCLHMLCHAAECSRTAGLYSTDHIQKNVHSRCIWIPRRNVPHGPIILKYFGTPLKHSFHPLFTLYVDGTCGDFSGTRCFSARWFRLCFFKCLALCTKQR